MIIKLDKVIGRTLIGYRYIDGKAPGEEYDELILDFDDGSEISVYVLEGEVIVEDD